MASISDGERRLPTELLSAPLVMTTGWQDVGGVIITDKIKYFTLWFDITINLSTDFQYQILATDAYSGGAFYPLPIKSFSSSLTSIEPEINQIETLPRQLVGHDLDKTIPFLKIQVKVLSTGATPAQLTSCKYSMAKGG
jgi:hypothetical protein